MQEPGRITAIRAQSRSPERVSIYVDGVFVFGVHRDVLLEFDVSTGMQLDVAVCEAMGRRDAFFRARAVAWNFLTYRDRSAEEVSRRLVRRGFEQDVVEEVIERLREAGVVDDEALARSYAESRFHVHGYGPRRVRADLRRRGVRPEAVEAAIAAVYEEPEDVVDRAREMGRKRWETLHRETDTLKRRKKVIDYLVRRGFGYGIAHQVVRELAHDDVISSRGD